MHKHSVVSKLFHALWFLFYRYSTSNLSYDKEVGGWEISARKGHPQAMCRLEVKLLHERPTNKECDFLCGTLPSDQMTRRLKSLGFQNPIPTVR